MQNQRRRKQIRGRRLVQQRDFEAAPDLFQMCVFDSSTSDGATRAGPIRNDPFDALVPDVVHTHSDSTQSTPVLKWFESSIKDGVLCTGLYTAQETVRTERNHEEHKLLDTIPVFAEIDDCSIQYSVLVRLVTYSYKQKSKNKIIKSASEIATANEHSDMESWTIWQFGPNSSPSVALLSVRRSAAKWAVP